ncbi:MAG TPA: SDR family NAD(P)-dependent oxidoreductase, partial [Rhodospirillales bacterium]|nr:SDR family NAD(P)-dependent oxidoreductase [Rhodospirillales bacterium]
MTIPETPLSGSVCDRLDLAGRVAVITGGGGLLGRKHAEAVAEMGAIPVLLDIDGHRAQEAAATVGGDAIGMATDITDEVAVRAALAEVLKAYGRLDILINNAANNPKVEGGGLADKPWSRLENFPVEVWNDDIAVGLTGAFICSRVFGAEMAKAGKGVILNIASDLGVIAPDQRIYREPGQSAEEQSVKPVTYSVVKAGLIGLTRYLATYWADKGVRANALAP